MNLCIAPTVAPGGPSFREADPKPDRIYAFRRQGPNGRPGSAHTEPAKNGQIGPQGQFRAMRNNHSGVLPPEQRDETEISAHP